MTTFLRNSLICLALVLAGTSMAYVNQKKVGIARDEVIYMTSGSRYAGWWGHLLKGDPNITSKEKITEYFGGKSATANNREHPPLMKTLFGVSERVLHRKLGVMDQLSAYRFPNAVLFGLSAGLVFLFAYSIAGLGAAGMASLLMLFMPRGLFHASLASFDAPVVTWWLATLLAYRFALRRRFGFLLLGIVFGLTLATKHNAIMMPVLLVVHWLFCIWKARKRHPLRSWWGSLRTCNPQLWFGVFIIAPAVLCLLWPWLWLDPLGHASEWIGFHLNHVHYNYEYLGRNWNTPPFPWHVPIVTTAFTLPTITAVASVLGLAMVGMGRMRDLPSARIHDDAPFALLFLSAGVALGPFVLGSTPIFGAEKHWAAAMPSLCIFAGVGIVYSTRWLAKALGQREDSFLAYAILFPLCTASLVAAALETFKAQPYALSHYTALAGGGAPGGASVGMNRQFWGYAAKGVLPVLNELEAETDRDIEIYTHDASVAWPWYRRFGWIDSKFKDAGHENQGIRKSKYALVIHEKHFNRHDYMVWQAYKTLKPVFVLQSDGVPLVSVYRRPDPKKEPPR